jgi:hypothetical protein
MHLQKLWGAGKEFMGTTLHGGRIGKFENLKIEIYASREAAGAAAATATADALQEIALVRKTFGVIFATGASQMATLNALSRIDQLPWGRCGDSIWMTTWICLPIIQRHFMLTFATNCPARTDEVISGSRRGSFGYRQNVPRLYGSVARRRTTALSVGNWRERTFGVQ